MCDFFMYLGYGRFFYGIMLCVRVVKVLGCWMMSYYYVVVLSVLYWEISCKCEILRYCMEEDCVLFYCRYLVFMNLGYVLFFFGFY